MIKKREVPFVKMHGNGNDFVIIENTNLKIEPKNMFLELFVYGQYTPCRDNDCTIMMVPH